MGIYTLPFISNGLSIVDFHIAMGDELRKHAEIAIVKNAIRNLSLVVIIYPIFTNKFILFFSHYDTSVKIPKFLDGKKCEQMRKIYKLIF